MDDSHWEDSHLNDFYFINFTTQVVITQRLKIIYTCPAVRDTARTQRIGNNYKTNVVLFLKCLTLNTNDISSKCAVNATGMGAAIAGVSSTPSSSIQDGSHDHAHSDQLSVWAGSAEFDDVASIIN